MEWPPFRDFGGAFYTHQVLLDINPGEGYAIRVEPHPRFFIDRTGECPIAVPALVRNWWPMLFFLVFKSPPEGQTHVFRPGEPMAQILVIPETAEFELAEMSMEEQADRELRSRRIYAARSTVTADTDWVSQHGHSVRWHLPPYGASREGQGRQEGRKLKKRSPPCRGGLRFHCAMQRSASGYGQTQPSGVRQHPSCQ